jgi:hypothetical protein
MAKLNPQQVKRTGLVNPAYAAATAGGDTVQPDTDLFLHFKSANASAVTVTIGTPGKVGGLDVADSAVVIPANGNALVGPIDGATYADPITGLANITYTLSGASITVAALQLVRQ